MTRPESKDAGQPPLWPRRRTALAFLLILLTAVHVPAGETVPETASREFFAVRAGSYPVRRWADQAAAQYLQEKGVYAFVDATPKSGENCRYRLYLGKFNSEVDARDLAQTLAGDPRISPAWGVETVSLARCRDRLAACSGGNKKGNKARSDKTRRGGKLHLPPSLSEQPPAVEKGKFKAPDHHRLILSILGGLNSPENDPVMELDRSGTGNTKTAATMVPAAPVNPTEFDLVPFTDQ